MKSSTTLATLNPLVLLRLKFKESCGKYLTSVIKSLTKESKLTKSKRAKPKLWLKDRNRAVTRTAAMPINDALAKSDVLGTALSVPYELVWMR